MALVKIFSSLFFLLIAFSTYAQPGHDFKLPETWAKDFVIRISFHSSMSGGKTEATFTFDSCTYKSQSHHSKKPKDGAYKMKEADRVAILKRLHELKADQIKSEGSTHAVRDGWSQSICFGDFNCIEGGSSAEMSETDKNQFLDAYRFLEEFAGKHAKSSKK